MKRRKRGKKTAITNNRARQPVTEDEPPGLALEADSRDGPSRAVDLTTSSSVQQTKVSLPMSSGVNEVRRSFALNCEEQLFTNDTPKTLESTRNHESNQRHIDPILGSDSQALSEVVHHGLGGQRIARTVWTTKASGLSAPFVFTGARRRPVGLSHELNTAQANLEIIQQLLDPWLSEVVTL